MEKITANHFITDDKTDKVYMSSLIDLDYASIPYTLHSPLVQPIELYMYVLSNP